MDRRLLTIVSSVVMVSMALTACGGGTTPMPTGQAAGPTETTMAQPVTISVWHGYTETEAETFTGAVDDFMAANSDVTVDLLSVPFDQLQSKFQTEAATGGGPTLVTGPQDRMAGTMKPACWLPSPKTRLSSKTWCPRLWRVVARWCSGRRPAEQQGRGHVLQQEHGQHTSQRLR